jgi:hypothetical protein
MPRKAKRPAPWPDVATARLFLNGLATGQWDEHCVSILKTINQDALARWLIRHALAPLANSRCRDVLPELLPLLAHSFFPAVARNIVRFRELSQVLESFRRANIPVVVFKGAALAGESYGGWSRRSMGDVDLWLRDEDVHKAADLMERLGFCTETKEDRPIILQSLAGGEIRFYKHGLIELHWSPFAGWWLQRTAAIDDDEIWQRAEPLTLDFGGTKEDQSMASESRPELVRQLAVEDAIIQIAVHITVNHQFGLVALRGLMDIALAVQAKSVDWTLVVARARQWRVSTVVWIVLDLTNQLIGLPGTEEALSSLRPAALRRALLKPLVSPQTVLEGRDLRESRARYLILLLLVDRPQDVVRLLFRTLWPEREWLEARYGKPTSHWRHFWNVVRHGRP